MDYRELAEAWANEILTSRWAETRYRLELLHEQVVMHRHLERQLYRATFRVWEHAGVAEVRLDRRGNVAGVRYPLPLDEIASEPGAVPPTQPDEVLEAATRAAVRVAKGQHACTQLEERRVERYDRQGPGLLVHLDQAKPDGQLVVELDPLGAKRVGFVCMPFFRGSTRSTALGKWAAVKRAQQAVELPPTAWVAYSALRTKPAGREWTFRFELRGQPELGWIKLTLNARTGALCGYSRVLRKRRVLDPAKLTDDEAARLLQAAARTRLGVKALVGEPIASAVVRGGKLVPAWLAVVVAPRGVYRATLAEGKVSMRKRVINRGSA